MGPALSCGWQYWLMTRVYGVWAAGGAGRWPPMALVYAPRVGLAAASLLLDAAAAAAARATFWASSSRGRQAHKSWSGAAAAGINAKLTLASAWPVLTMQLRPFRSGRLAVCS